MIYGAVSGGMALGPLIAGILADRFSFRSTFLIASAVLLAAGTLVVLGTREHFIPPRPEDRRKALSFKVLFASSGFALACLIYFLIAFSNWARADTFPLLMQRLIGAGVSDTGLSGHLVLIGRRLAGVRGPRTSLNGLVLFVAGIGAMCAAPLWGRLGDGWGHKRAMVLCCVLAGALAIPTAFSRSIGEALIWSTLLWMAGAGTVPCINTIIRDTIGTANIGKAYGLTQCVAALGWGLGPLSAGLLASYVDVWASFTLIGVVLLTVPFIAPLLRTPQLPDP